MTVAHRPSYFGPSSSTALKPRMALPTITLVMAPEGRVLTEPSLTSTLPAARIRQIGRVSVRCIWSMYAANAMAVEATCMGCSRSALALWCL